MFVHVCMCVMRGERGSGRGLPGSVRMLEGTMATRVLTQGDGMDLERFSSCSLDKFRTKPVEWESNYSTFTNTTQPTHLY